MKKFIGNAALVLLLIPTMFFISLGIQVACESLGFEWRLLSSLFIAYIAILSVSASILISNSNQS